MAAEKNFENQIKKFLSEQGCYYIKTHGDRFSKVGIPDLIIDCNGFFIGAEIKAINGHPSELQLYHLEQINDSGGIGIILVQIEGVEKIKKYISSNFPRYQNIKVLDLEKFKKLVSLLKRYETIGKDIVF